MTVPFWVHVQPTGHCTGGQAVFIIWGAIKIPIGGSAKLS